MTELVKQPTAMPTRKVMAAIIAGMVTGGLQSVLVMLFPNFDFTEVLMQVDIWVQTGVMTLAMYMTKEREYVRV